VETVEEVAVEKEQEGETGAVVEETGRGV